MNTTDADFDTSDPLGPAKGILVAALLGTLLWGAVGVALFKLL